MPRIAPPTTGELAGLPHNRNMLTKCVCQLVLISCLTLVQPWATAAVATSTRGNIASNKSYIAFGATNHCSCQWLVNAGCSAGPAVSLSSY